MREGTVSIGSLVLKRRHPAIVHAMVQEPAYQARAGAIMPLAASAKWSGVILADCPKVAALAVIPGSFATREAACIAAGGMLAAIRGLPPFGVQALRNPCRN